MATGYGLDDQEVGVQVPVGARIFSSPRRPDWLCGPTNLLSNGYWGLFLRGSSGRGVKLTTHLQLVPRSRRCGSIHPLPHTPSWHSAQLVKHRDNFPFTTESGQFYALVALPKGNGPPCTYGRGSILLAQKLIYELMAVVVGNLQWTCLDHDICIQSLIFCSTFAGKHYFQSLQRISDVYKNKIIIVLWEQWIIRPQKVLTVGSTVCWNWKGSTKGPPLTYYSFLSHYCIEWSKKKWWPEQVFSLHQISVPTGLEKCTSCQSKLFPTAMFAILHYHNH
jgi:hypothetical protein